MIYVNNTLIQIQKFPDGTPHISGNQIMDSVNDSYIDVTWLYDDNAELMYLIFILNYIKDAFNKPIELYIPYLPNARMDREKDIDDVFTLKYFCNFINSFKVDCITTYDVHSNVSCALLDNHFDETPKDQIKEVIDARLFDYKDNLVLFFPDEGAMKRYSFQLDFPYAFGVKNRDWKTGKIQGLTIMDNGIDLTGKTILIIDDICSKGGTFYHSAKKLKEIGVDDIYLWISHCEDNIYKGDLPNSGLIKKVFTTNSILRNNQNPDWVEVLEVF